MRIALNNGDVLSMCYCQCCQHIGGKFQLRDINTKKIYIKSGNDIAELIKNGSNK